MSNMEDLSFTRKYRPSTISSYIGNEKLKQTAMKALKNSRKPQVIMLYGNSGCGKAQPLDSLVLTTSGYKRMGDIEVGDEVFTDKGNKGKVSGVFPQGIRPIYRITLSDGTYIDVADNHLNCVWNYNNETGEREDYVLDTKELIEFHKEHNLDTMVDTVMIPYPEYLVSISPYIVGMYVVSGSYCDGYYTLNNLDSYMADYLDRALYDELMTLSPLKGRKDCYRIVTYTGARRSFCYQGEWYNGFKELKGALKFAGYPEFSNKTILGILDGTATKTLEKFPELGEDIEEQSCGWQNEALLEGIEELGLLCKLKENRIPVKYLYGGLHVRFDTMLGILDTYDYSKSDIREFKTDNALLSDDFATLVRSIGIVDTIDKVGSYYRHVVNLKGVNAGSLKTLGKRRKSACKSQIRCITSIERVGDKECQCIMVDHPDHTYVSDFFIPTHNTTFARLLAKEYSCENRDDELGACGQCPSCQVIEEYITTGDTSVLTNIRELNIADQSGKRDLDDTFEDMTIPTFGDEWKIYIFDECHKASIALQNRFLKIVEEPPEHILIIFCTTNPEEMIDTLKNRCQLQLKVNKPKVKELAGLLKKVCGIEQVEYDMQGLEFIANRGELTIRTALHNLEQVITEYHSATYDNATKVFEAVSNTIIINIFKALKNKDTLRYITLLYDVRSKMELDVFLAELKGFVTRGIYTVNGIVQDGVSDGELKIYRDLFGDLGIEKTAYLLDRLLNLNKKNLELELMMLGYTGLLDMKSVSNEPSSVFDVPVEGLDKELQAETAMTNKVLREQEQEEVAKGVENAKRQMDSVSVDDILSMGGQLVE